MEILKTFVVSVLSFFGISTQSISTREVQTSVIKEIQKPQPTIETNILTEEFKKETDKKELIEETIILEPTKEDLLKEKIRHKNEGNIAFIKARKEQEKPKKKRQPPVKIEVQESEWERILREGKIISEMNKEREIKKKVLEKIAFDELLEKKYKEAPRKTLTLPEFGIELTYPEMDFTEIIVSNEKTKEARFKTNIEFYTCGERHHYFPCKKGVNIYCYVSSGTDDGRLGTYNRNFYESKYPVGVEINITEASLPEYITSQIKKRSFYIFKPPPFLENSKKLKISTQKTINIDNIPADKFKLSNGVGFNLFVPGKNYNYIIGYRTDAQACVQEIIESIEFLDK